MYKRIVSIFIALIMSLIFLNYRAEAVALYNEHDFGYNNIAIQAPNYSENSANDEEYPLKYKKKIISDQNNVNKAAETIDKARYKEVTNIAFFGLDRRNEKDSSRSDAIMIVSIDSKYEKVKVTSLMRDMYVKIPGKEDNRINAAYAYGGAELALKTINSDFNLDIKNYVTVDFFGFEKIIDKVGGIEINVKKNEIPYLNDKLSELDESHEYYVTKEGSQLLNGWQAVAYSRIRYTGNADYERTERQRRVLDELFKKTKKQGILKLTELVANMLPFVKTNMTTKDIISLGSKTLKFKTANIEQYRLPADGTYKSADIRGMSVLVPDMDVNRKKLLEFIYKTK